MKIAFLQYLPDIYSIPSNKQFFAMTFGTKLRKLRLEKGYSQTYVADFIGIDQSSYCRLESDKVQPKLQTALKIAHLYEVDLTMLYAATLGFL